MIIHYLAKYCSTFVLGWFSLTLFSQELTLNPVLLPDPKDFGGRVNCIFQDKVGYIWIGKNSGLYRYDGSSLTPFRHSSTDTSSISCNIIRSITEDASGDLWIGTNGGGLNRYHRKTGKFIRYLHDDKNPNSISFDEVYTIVPDRKGNFWVGTDGGGLNFFNPATGHFQCFRAGQQPTKGLRSNKVLHFSLAYNGKYWLACWGGGVHLFDPIGKNVTPIGNGSHFEKSNVLCAKEVRPGILWLATFDDGLVEYNIKSQKFTTIIPRVGIDSFRDIQLTANGGIFVASNNGLLYFSSPTAPYKVVESSNSAVFTIIDILLDRDQTIWVGSGSGLVGKINSFRKQFHTFSSTSPFKETDVYSVSAGKDPDKVFFAYRNTLCSYNFATKTHKLYTLPYLYSISILEVPGLNLILCTSSNGIVAFDKITGRVSRIKIEGQNPVDLLEKEIYSIYPGGNNEVWVATRSAVCLIGFVPKTKSWKVINVFPVGAAGGIANCHFPTCFLQHPNGDLYIGTKGGGLNRRRAGQSEFITYIHNTSNSKSISDNSIECMALATDGNIWIGTQSGLNLFNPQTSVFKTLWVSDGLADDWVFSIATDPKGKAWASTRRGITSVSGDFKNIRNYDFTDGLPNAEFQPRAVSTDSTGKMYFGSKRGLVWFHPDSIRDNPYLPEAVITGFKTHTKKTNSSDTLQLKQCVEMVKEIRLNHRQRSFSFQMAAINYFNPQKSRLQYKLAGFDKDWQWAGTNLMANYTNIPAGKYIFFVRATNENGIFNPNEKQIDIIITSPLWMKWWAIIFYIGGFVCICIYVVYWWVKVRVKPTGLQHLGNSIKHDYAVPGEVISEPSGQKFIQKVLHHIEENISDPEFGVHELAEKMCISRPQLYRKVHSVTGVSVSEFIRVVRLKRAAQLLLQSPESISEVAYQAGFNVPKYFSKCFKQQFGVSPAQYIANSGKHIPPE